MSLVGLTVVLLVIVTLLDITFKAFSMMVTGCRFGQTECVLFLPILGRNITTVIQLARSKDASPLPALHTFVHFAVDRKRNV